VDVGGDDDLRTVAMAPAAQVSSAFPGQSVRWETNEYGRSTWGVCLGAVEVVFVRDRAGWGVEVCEKSGVRVVSLPYARGVQIAFSDRAVVRDDVAAYVTAAYDSAGAALRRAGVARLDGSQLQRSRARAVAFVEQARASGVEPITG
jgi:hypothetical protein